MGKEGISKYYKFIGLSEPDHRVFEFACKQLDVIILDGLFGYIVESAKKLGEVQLLVDSFELVRKKVSSFGDDKLGYGSILSATELLLDDLKK